MKKLTKYLSVILAVLFIGLLFNCKSNIHAFTTNPNPTQQYVVDDYAHLLNHETKHKVISQEKYYKYHTETKPQIVLMTVPNSHDESVDDYADDLLSHKQWHFGNPTYNNGTLILFARNHGQNNVRISTGYGMESVLPDIKCHSILERNKVYLKSSNRADINVGLDNVFHSVSHTVNKKYAHLSKKQALALKHKKEHEHTFDFWFGAMLITLVILVLIIAVFGEYRGPGDSGGFFDFGNDDFGSGGFSDFGVGGSFGGGGASI